jgi:deoxyribose-phosphate aldolase
MKSEEIFDKEGNALSVSDLIYNFIKESAEKSNKDIEDIYVGVDIGFPKGKTPVWIYTTESIDNGYDAVDLHEFGEPVKVNETRL